MDIRKIKIVNFKSIGENTTTFNLHSGVVALIGKNEAGKSNIIDGINSIKFTSKNDLQRFANRKNSNSTVSFEFEIYFTKEEAEKNSVDCMTIAIMQIKCIWIVLI